MAKPKKLLMVSIVIILIIAVIAISLMLFYANTVRSVLDDEITSNLKEITLQESEIIETQVNGDLYTLESVATVLQSNDFSGLDTESTMKLLDKIRDQNGFKRMGLIDPDGNAVTTDGLSYDFSERKYFRKALAGIPNISDTFTDIVDGNSINVYAVPIYSGRNVVSVLFATHATDVFENKISVSTFEGNGYAYVVEKNGDKIARSHHENSVEFENFFELDGNLLVSIDGNSFETMHADMQKGESGVTQYKKAGILYYMSYAPINVNDWYILSVVPASVVSEKSSFLIAFTGWISGIIVFTVVILLVYIAISQSNAKKRLERIAFVDELTGASSWVKFRSDCNDILKDHANEKYAFINFDINKFKIFNQLYGYRNGNLLIRHISAVLKNDMREHELYCRAGSDEFNVLITYSDENEISGRISGWNNRIRSFPFIRKKNYNLLLSYGVYIVPKNDYSVTRMSDWSKTAKNSVKSNAHNYYAFYDDSMNQKMLHEKQLENDMDAALQSNEFVVYYQPKFDLDSEKPVAAEALVRWISPDKGFMNPGEFIPVFEKNGFIVKIDFYVFEQVCRMLRDWLDHAMPVVPISVNFSRLHIYNDDFVKQLLDITEKYGLSPGLLEIELTESALIDNDDLILTRMNELRDAGFSISIDDFGTGYSSLNLLRTLPVDVIKLDKRFFTHEDDNDRETTIISSIIAMSEKLGITVVAEGVELRAQADFLRNIGYRIIVQGFLYAKPMPEDAFEELLRKNMEQ